METSMPTVKNGRTEYRTGMWGCDFCKAAVAETVGRLERSDEGGVLGVVLGRFGEQASPKWRLREKTIKALSDDVNCVGLDAWEQGQRLMASRVRSFRKGVLGEDEHVWARNLGESGGEESEEEWVAPDAVAAMAVVEVSESAESQEETPQFSLQLTECAEKYVQKGAERRS